MREKRSATLSSMTGKIICGGWAVQASQQVTRDDYYYSVPPTRVFAFTTWPGTGCEQANFGLGIYPATIEVEQCHRTITIPTGIKGWSWSSFCKTQYASDPSWGGVPHFLRCHLSVIKMLDHAKQLGVLASVSDEGGFWEERNVEALAKQVGEWNEKIAGLAGQLKDALGDDVAAPSRSTPITNTWKPRAADQREAVPMTGG